MEFSRMFLFPDYYDASMIKISQDLVLKAGSDPILAIVSTMYPSIVTSILVHAILERDKL